MGFVHDTIASILLVELAFKIRILFPLQADLKVGPNFITIAID